MLTSSDDSVQSQEKFQEYATKNLALSISPPSDNGQRITVPMFRFKLKLGSKVSLASFGERFRPRNFQKDLADSWFRRFARDSDLWTMCRLWRAADHSSLRLFEGFDSSASRRRRDYFVSTLLLVTNSDTKLNIPQGGQARILGNDQAGSTNKLRLRENSPSSFVLLAQRVQSQLQHRTHLTQEGSLQLGWERTVSRFSRGRTAT